MRPDTHPYTGFLRPADQQERPDRLPRLFKRLRVWSAAAAMCFSPNLSAGRQYGMAFATFVAASFLNLWLRNRIGYQTIALVYLLAVVWLALFVNRGPIIFGTALTAVGWRFLFAPPRFSFNIADSYDEMMFATYFAVALTVGQLTTRLRAQRAAEREREARASALYLLTKELADGANRADILDKVVHQVGAVFNAQVAILLPDSAKTSELSAHPAGTWQPNESERAIAAWTFAHNQAAGRVTTNSSDAQGLYLPLSAGGQPAGVIGLHLDSGGVLNRQQYSLLEHFVGQISLVLDRQLLRDAETQSKLLAESERLGRTLLNSVSHELRTPISAISSASGGLLTAGTLTPLQRELAAEIESASARLNRVVQSLLSAARLRAGQIRPKPDWCDVADLARDAMEETSEVCATHPVALHIAPDMPLVKMDFALTQQALANLLVNAATHTPAGTPIEVSARIENRMLVLQVSDHGPGLPPEQLDRVFELFHRLPNARPGGTGLGLAIAKGFLEAQGGQVWAANRAGGGAIFSLCLPATDQPELPAEIQ